jgi:hypothetical protein
MLSATARPLATALLAGIDIGAFRITGVLL